MSCHRNNIQVTTLPSSSGRGHSYLTSPLGLDENQKAVNQVHSALNLK